MSIARDARQAVAEYRRFKRLEALSAESKKNFEALEKSVIEVMDADGVPSVRVDMASMTDDEKLVDVPITVVELKLINDALMFFVQHNGGVVDPSVDDTGVRAMELRNSLQETTIGFLASCSGVQTITKTARMWAFAQIQKSNENREANLAVLREWHPDIVSESINAQTLSAIVKEMTGWEPGNEVELPDELKSAINVDVREKLSIRKA